MDAKKNKKLCWSCEGEIDRDATSCLFCGSQVNVSVDSAAHAVPHPPYQVKDQAEVLSADEQEEAVETSSTTLSFILLLAGTVFAVFAFLLLFFSEDNVLKLQWDASYWFVYLLVSVPLFIFGWKLVKE